MMTTILLADLTNRTHQEAIGDLLDMYCRDEFGNRQSLPEQVRTNLIPGLLKHGGARVFLAFAGEKPVGMALCFLGFSTFRGRSLLNIHDLAVRPEVRGQGVGRQLLAAAQAEARALGCCKVTLEVRADNVRAQGLYRSVGFQPGTPETLFWTQSLD